MTYSRLKIPPKWVSAHRKNEYKLAFDKVNVLGTYNASGYFGVLLSSSLAGANVGDRVYIYSGSGSSKQYEGYHVIREVISTIQFVFETAYNGVLLGVNEISNILLPTVKIYKGYKVGEVILAGQDLYDIMPYELIGEFVPESNLKGEIQFDFCGYLKTAIESPYKGEYNQDEVNYNYGENYIPKNYNRVQLLIDTWMFGEHYVANSSISTEELNRYFVDTERQLQPLKQPIFISPIGAGIGTYINNDLMTKKYNI